MELFEMELSEMASSDPFGMGTRSPLAGVPGGPSVRPETALERWNAEDRRRPSLRVNNIEYYYNCFGTLVHNRPFTSGRSSETVWYTLVHAVHNSGFLLPGIEVSTQNRLVHNRLPRHMM